ncbi:hypothetical protein HPA16_03075 [Streptococcus suis]|nr:hypothetical protein [Streptococcus suis]
MRVDKSDMNLKKYIDAKIENHFARSQLDIEFFNTREKRIKNGIKSKKINEIKKEIIAVR